MRLGNSAICSKRSRRARRCFSISIMLEAWPTVLAHVSRATTKASDKAAALAQPVDALASVGQLAGARERAAELAACSVDRLARWAGKVRWIHSSNSRYGS